MDYFVIGDIHGCYYTFTKLIDQHWNRDKEVIIQVGDLVDRGNNVPEMVKLAIELSNKFPEQVIFLKGNHEFEMARNFSSRANFGWRAMGGSGTLKQYQQSERDIEEDVNWMKQLPLYWENEHIFISHAGIAEQAEDPFEEGGLQSILWNRSRLKNLGKLQIVGHTPGDKPVYDEQSHTWNIDTGAVFANYLTGIKVSEDGNIKEFIKQKTDPRDVR